MVDLAKSCKLKVIADCTHRDEAFGAHDARPRANDRLELPDGAWLERALGPAERQSPITNTINTLTEHNSTTAALQEHEILQTLCYLASGLGWASFLRSRESEFSQQVL